MAKQPVKTAGTPKIIKSKNTEYNFNEDAWEKQKDLALGFAETFGSTEGFVNFLKDNKNVIVEAQVIGVEKDGENAHLIRVNGREDFIRLYESNKKRSMRFLEGVDWFGTDMTSYSTDVGQDYTPLLGGPFSKQLYLTDYLQMHSQCFFAMNHDPIIKTYLDILCDFVLGRGYRADTKTKAGRVLWRAFEEVNDLQQLMRHFLREEAGYGEQMVWWLPDNATAFRYHVPPEQAAAKGLLPRIRLIDPSTCWEIVTFPEDIKSVLYYQLLFPTQYQIYTGSDGGKPVPTSKFVFQQVPANQVDHYKLNCAYNEKRGRSDIFPVLGYAKRLRDSVNYSIVGMQKTTAWSIDTEIDGNQADIDSYVNAQNELGSIPPAGSEFVHSTKVKRNYLSNQGSATGAQSQSFDWCFAMICSGLGVPQSYFATHVNGGGATKANALVATEPVAKKFQMRQRHLESVLQNMAKRLFKMFGIEDELEVTFPEIIVQDRDAKLKSLALAESMKWISHERAAIIAAKELQIDKYEWQTEEQEIADEQKDPVLKEPPPSAPLTTPAQIGLGIGGQRPTGSEPVKK